MKSEIIFFILSILILILAITITFTWVHESAHIEDMTLFNVNMTQVCLLGWNGRSIAWIQPASKWDR